MVPFLWNAILFIDICAIWKCIRLDISVLKLNIRKLLLTASCTFLAFFSRFSLLLCGKRFQSSLTVPHWLLLFHQIVEWHFGLFMLHSALLRVESVDRALLLITGKLLFCPSLYKIPWHLCGLRFCSWDFFSSVGHAI